MLSWIAASTSRLRVLPRVLGVPYRAPAVVAKMAESFDRLSGGRLILGLGAGASDAEFRALGLPIRTLHERMSGLEDAIRISRGLWSEPTFTFKGAIYETDAAELEPKPEHSIPIWIGTHGRRGLAITGRLADGWIPSLENAPPDQAPAMLRIIHDAASEAGRDPSDVARIYNLEVAIDGVGDSSVVSGEAGEVIERLVDFLKLGFTGFNFILAGQDKEEQMQRLANEVIPAVRAAS